MDANNNYLFILLILILPVGAFLYMRNKKKNESESIAVGSRKERKDEVWNVVKKYLKENGETGKEILQMFPAKKRDENDVTNMTKEQKIAYKQKKKAEKAARKADPELQKKYKEDKRNQKYNRKPEEWFIFFQTWNSRSKVIDEPRILSVEIRYVRIDKKKTERKVIVTGLADYDKEFEWIKPLKEKEDKIIEKQTRINEAKKQRVEENKKKREKKEQARELARQEKENKSAKEKK